MLGLATLAAAAPAVAELRTGSAANGWPEESDGGSPTRPELERASVRYETTTGTITITLTFATAVADPASTSALRSYAYEVTLGDRMNEFCGGSERAWLGINGRLTDPAPGTVTRFLDLDGTFKRPITPQFDAERRTLTLTASDPAFVGLNLICAQVGIRTRFDNSLSSGSSTQDFLLDGFSRVDGDIIGQAEEDLSDSIDWLNRDWVNPNRGRRFLRSKVRCQRLVGPTLTCRATSRLVDVRGRPSIQIRGDMTYPQPYTQRGGNQPRWQYGMRVVISWRKCPRGQRGVRRKPSGGCSRTVSWRGNRTLSRAVLG
jgi:hypothetical protein